MAKHILAVFVGFVGWTVSGLGCNLTLQKVALLPSDSIAAKVHGRGESAAKLSAA